MAEKNIEIYLNLEYIIPHDRFGLNIVSVAFKAGTVFDGSEEKLLPIFRPWLATEFVGASATAGPLAETAGGPAACKVAEDLVWKNGLKVDRQNYPQSFRLLITGLEKQFEDNAKIDEKQGTTTVKKLNKVFLSGRAAPENNGTAQKVSQKMWGMMLGQTTILPAPIPHLINLQRFVDVPAATQGQMVLIAPILKFNIDGTEVTLKPVGVPTMRKMDAAATPLNSIWEWAYEDLMLTAPVIPSPTIPPGELPTVPPTTPPADVIKIKAFVSPVVKTNAAVDGPYVDLTNLLVKDPDRQLSSIRNNWRATLEKKLSESLNLCEWIMQFLKDQNDQGVVIPTGNLMVFTEMFLAALRDVCGMGVATMPDKQILAQTVLEKAQPVLKPLRDNPKFAVFLANVHKSVDIQFAQVANWRGFLRDEFFGKGSDPFTMKILQEPKTDAVNDPLAATLKETIAEMGTLYTTLSQAQPLADLFCKQWAKIEEQLTDATEKSWARLLANSQTNKGLENVPLRAVLVKENIGFFWDVLLKSMLVDDNGMFYKLVGNEKQYYVIGVFEQLFKDYCGLRFADGTVTDDRKKMYDPKVFSLRPEMKAGPAATNLIKDVFAKFIDNHQGDFIPEAGAQGAPDQAAEPTSVPAAVSFIVDKVESIPVAAHDDLLRQIAGIGVLLAEKPDATINQTEWRCLNNATATVYDGTAYQPLFVEAPASMGHPEPVLVGCKINYTNDLRNGLITYDNHPLSGESPVTDLTLYELQTSGPEIKPLFKFRYPSPAKGKLTPLIFGKSYQALPFLVTNSGAIAKDLASGSPVTIKQPKDIRPSQTHLRSFSYYRTVRVGGLRFAGIEGDEKLTFPPVPSNVFPIIRDMKSTRPLASEAVREKDGGTKVFDASNPEPPEDLALQERPLILLAPNKRASNKSEIFDMTVAKDKFEFYLRPPAVDVETWHRWVMGGFVHGDKFAGNISDLSKAVLRSYYYLHNENRILKEGQEAKKIGSAVKPKDITIDDPAVAGFYIELLDAADEPAKAAGAKPTEKQVASPVVIWIKKTAAVDLSKNDLEYDLRTFAQFGGVKVTCQVVGTANLFPVKNEKGMTTIEVNVVEGGLYRLRVSCLLPAVDYPAPGGKPRFDKIYEGNNRLDLVKDSAQQINHFRVSPSEMFIEVATDNMDEILQPDETIKELVSTDFDSTTASDVITVDLRDDGVDTLKKFKYIGRVELFRQMWRWQGRNSKPHPEQVNPTPPPKDKKRPTAAEKAAMRAADDRDTAWQLIEYAGREELDYSIVPAQFAATADGQRTFVYTETLRGEERSANGRTVSVKEDLRALHYRFRAVFYSRYDGLLRPTAAKTTAKWTPQFVQCRLDPDPESEKLQPPAVQYVFPLTESFSSENPSSSAGLLVVLNEPWYRIGGVGETLGVEVALVNSPTDRDGNFKTYFEIGADPIVDEGPLGGPMTAPVLSDSKVTFDPKLICGPIGHTFDEDGKNPLFSLTSFMIPAPKIEWKGGVSDAVHPSDLPGWGMAKISISRVMPTPHNPTRKKIVSKSTPPQWVQFLPELFVKKPRLVDPGTAYVALSPDSTKLVIKGKDGNQVIFNKDPIDDFQYYLIVMKEVVDAAGAFGEVVFMGICSLESNGEWAPENKNLKIKKDSVAGSPAVIEPTLSVEVIQIQRRHNGQVIANSPTLWKNLFDPTVPDRDRARIVAISPRIMTKPLKECEDK
jgi:hypothetical protein